MTTEIHYIKGTPKIAGFYIAVLAHIDSRGIGYEYFYLWYNGYEWFAMGQYITGEIHKFPLAHKIVAYAELPPVIGLFELKTQDMIRKNYEANGQKENTGGMTVAQKVAEAGSYVGVGKTPAPGDQVVVNEQEEEEVRGILAGLRRDADSLHKTVEELAAGDRSRALSLAITNFQEARQFLGCLLKERGSKSPYVLGNDSSTTALESNLWDPGKSYYEKPADGVIYRDHYIITAKRLREKAADVITDFTVYAEKSVSRGFAEAAMLPHVYTKLVAGRNWLGEYLGEKARESNAG